MKESMSSKILIKNAEIITMERADNGVLAAPFRGNVVVEGCLIKSVSREEAEGSFDTVIDADGFVAMPGLINTHGHAAMALFRGYADDTDLMSWLNDKIFPIEDRLRGEDVYNGTMLAVAEMLKSGTTAFADMYFFMDDTARAVCESGIRASLSQGLTEPDQGAPDKLETAVDFARRLNGAADGRITTMLGPHAPYTSSPAYMKRIIDAATAEKLPLHIHLAETQNETEQIMARYGKRPVALLAELGLFENKVLAAHGVYLNSEEIELLSRYNVSVAHNPRSNMKLASGIAPVAEMLAKGINVSLGTDSACSNNNLDMFQEMRAAALLAKLKNLDPKSLPAAEVLAMATVNGAKALGIDNLAILRTGYKADIILVNTRRLHMSPSNDIVSHLVYAASGSDVDTVIVDGRILVSGGELLFMDEERIIAAADKSMNCMTGTY